MVGENVVITLRNVERLISRCEDILGERVKIRGQKWRIPKYVESLSEMITELDTKHSASVNTDQLRSFKQRLSVIQEITRQEQMKIQRKRDPDSSFISPARCISPGTVTLVGVTGNPLQRSLDSADVHGSGLLRRTLSRNYREMREDLFSKDDSYGSPRQSSVIKEEGTVETVLAKHQEMQEKIAHDMILIARSLKDHSLAARDIIKSDKEVLKKTIDIADTNIEGVNRETGRLKEKNRSCSWGIWILLLVVFVVFIQMVIFMRMFPKPK